MTDTNAALLAMLSTIGLAGLYYMARAAWTFEEPEDCESWSRD